MLEAFMSNEEIRLECARIASERGMSSKDTLVFAGELLDFVTGEIQRGARQRFDILSPHGDTQQKC
jgi:hypothetical protein